MLKNSTNFLGHSNALRLMHVKTFGFHGCGTLFRKHQKSSISERLENVVKTVSFDTAKLKILHALHFLKFIEILNVEVLNYKQH